MHDPLTASVVFIALLRSFEIAPGVACRQTGSKKFLRERCGSLQPGRARRCLLRSHLCRSSLCIAAICDREYGDQFQGQQLS